MNWIKRLPPSFWVVIISIAALFIRVYHLDFQSLWLDELWTMYMANPVNSFGDIYEMSKTVDGISVMYFMIVNVFFKVFGYNEIVVRSVSVLFGVFAMSGIYLLGKELFNRRTGLFAACVLCVNQYHVSYSQDGRPYAMYGAAVIFSFYFMLRFMRDPSRKRAVYYGLATTFMLLSHFYAMFVIGAQGLILAYVLLFSIEKEKRKMFLLQGLLALGIVVVGFLPEIPILLKWANIKSFWIPVPTNNAFMDQVYDFFGWSMNILNISVLFITLFLLRVFSRKENDALEEGDKNPTAAFYIITCWILVTFFIPYIRSYLVVPMVYPRYMMGMMPAVMLLIAAGIGMIADNKLRIVVLLLYMVIGFLEMAVGRNYYSNPLKASFRGVTKYAIDHNAIFAELRTPLPFHFGYYLKKFESKGAMVETPWLDNVLEAERTTGQAPKPFWVLLAHGTKYSFTNDNANYLNTAYTKVKSLTMTDASAEFFVPAEKLSPDSLRKIYEVPLDNFALGIHENGELGVYKKEDTVNTNIQLKAGAYKLLIKAQTIPANLINGEPAHITVLLDRKPLGGFYIKPEHFLKGAMLDMKIQDTKTYNLMVRFDNDKCKEGSDRNFIIRQVRIISTDSINPLNR